MIRRKARERREYLYRKAVEDRHRTIQDKKDRVKNALASNKLLDPDVKRDALELAKKNVEKFYSVVGVTELWDETLEVLENKLPFFFKGTY